MPAVTQVILYDDEAWQDDRRVEAEEVVRLTLTRQPAAGGEPARRSCELYLSGAGAARLDAELDPWFVLGHVPAGRPDAGRPKATKSMRFGPQGAPNSSARRDYWDGWKRWAQGLGLKNKDGVHEVWETGTGSSGYHPIPVCEAYELHLAGREEEALAKLAPYLPRQPRRKAG